MRGETPAGSASASDSAKDKGMDGGSAGWRPSRRSPGRMAPGPDDAETPEAGTGDAA